MYGRFICKPVMLMERQGQGTFELLDSCFRCAVVRRGEGKQLASQRGKLSLSAI